MSGVPGLPVYQAMRPGWQRPGLTTAAAVLGFVQAGLAIFGGLITLVAALGSAVDDAADLRSGTDPLGAEVAQNLALTTVVGALVVLGGGVAIAGSVLLIGGRDRVFYVVGMALQLAFCILYFTLGAIVAHRIDQLRGPFGRPDNPAYGFMVIAVFFAVLPIVGLVFASVRTSTQFLRATAADPDGR